MRRLKGGGASSEYLILAFSKSVLLGKPSGVSVMAVETHKTVGSEAGLEERLNKTYLMHVWCWSGRPKWDGMGDKTVRG